MFWRSTSGPIAKLPSNCLFLTIELQSAQSPQRLEEAFFFNFLRKGSVVVYDTMLHCTQGKVQPCWPKG